MGLRQLKLISKLIRQLKLSFSCRKPMQPKRSDLFDPVLCSLLKNSSFGNSLLIMVTLLIVLLLAQEAHLSEVNNWDKIEDFNWLSSSAPSPNWNILPESQRTHVTDATNGL